MSGERPGEAAAAEAVAAAFEPWSEESVKIAREQAELVVAAAYPVIAEAVRAEERERTLEACVEACVEALTKDAMPNVWWFVGEAVNRVRDATARLARGSS